jgi:hypothetical protein
MKKSAKFASVPGGIRKNRGKAFFRPASLVQQALTSRAFKLSTPVDLDTKNTANERGGAYIRVFKWLFPQAGEPMKGQSPHKLTG